MIEGYCPSWMTQEMSILQESVRRFAKEEVLPRDEEWQKQHMVDRATLRKAGELGILLADVSEEYGGSGGNFGHEAVIYHELAVEGDFSLVTSKSVSSIVAHYILECGTEEQKQLWLPRLASGEISGAICMTEPDAGSDLKALKTRAVRRGDKYIVSGTKTFISNGLTAGVLVVAAKTDTAAGTKGISLIIIDPANTPGFKVGRVLEKMGLGGQDTCEMFFDDCEVPVANLLGGVEGQGFNQLMEQLPYERLIVSLMAAAYTERALKLTVDYTKERQMFGGTLFDLQNTRITLSEVATNAMVGRVFNDYLVERAILGKLDTVSASMGKWWTTEMECQGIDRCLQMFGGYGYMKEYPITRMFTDTRIHKIFAGANEVMKELIAKAL